MSIYKKKIILTKSDVENFTAKDVYFAVLSNNETVENLWRVVTVVRVDGEYVEVSGEESQVIDFKHYELSHMEPLSDHYKDSEIRFNNYNGTMRLDFDNLDSLFEYQDRTFKSCKKDNVKVYRYKK
jgi:hypothetical protein